MEERFRFLLEYPQGARNDFDSLSNVFWHHFNSQKKDTMCCFYYIKSTQSLNQKLYNYNVKQGENSVGETSQRGKYVIKYQNTDSSTSQEIFNLFPNATFYNNKWNLKNIGGASMSNLGWFAAFDISQAYYSINLNSSTIDSLTLEIGFVGATDFSKMIPEPDIITMRSIKFTHPKKIMTIKKNGLQFHAHFKETENRQTIRLYILTGVLSAIVGFLLRALYRLYIINNKQQ